MAEKAKEEVKEFQPVGPDDQTEEQRATVVFIDKNWKDHPWVKNYHGKWEELIAWTEGNQYTEYIESTGELVDVEPYVEREIKNVYNRILPQVRQIWGELRYPHEFYVDANTLESEDIKAAKIGSSFIEYTNDLRDFIHKVNFSKLWAIITGVCFWKEWWNGSLSSAGKKTKDGKLSPAKGDVDYNYVNPFNVRPDPLAKDREGWRWLIEGKRTPKSSVEDEFKLPRGTLPEDERDATDTGLFERTDLEKSKEKTSIRKEYWQVKSTEYPKGRFIVVAGGWLLYDGENPSPDAEIPYFQIPGVMPILNEAVYDSFVRMAQEPQRRLNRLGSMVDERIEDYRLKAMIPFTSLRGGDLKAYQRAGVDFVEYNPMAGTPHWQAPPAISSDIINHLHFQENEIETATSIRKPSLAQLPEYASRASGVLFDALKRQDEIVLYPVVEDIDKVLKSVLKFRLKLIQENYTQPRMIKTLGRNKRISISFFKGADLRDNTDVQVRPGIDFISNRKMRKDIVQTLVEKGLIKDERKALELMDYKGLEEYMEDEFIDERQAHRQLEIMKDKGTNILAHDEDNHEVHYKIFNNARKAEDFDSLSEKTKENIEERIKEHKRLMREPIADKTPEGTPLGETTPGAVAPAGAGLPPEIEAIISKAEKGGM